MKTLFKTGKLENIFSKFGNQKKILFSLQERQTHRRKALSIERDLNCYI